jgi:hypothetical protein
MRIARHAAKLVPGQVKEQYKSRKGRLVIRRAEPKAMSLPATGADWTKRYQKTLKRFGAKRSGLGFSPCRYQGTGFSRAVTAVTDWALAPAKLLR